MLMAPRFRPFIDQSPLSVMARLTIERALRPALLDDLFERTAERQYTREPLFSSLVDLMSLVTCGSARHVRAGFQRLKERIPVSLKCVCEKLQRMGPGVCAELVRATSESCASLIRELGGAPPDPCRATASRSSTATASPAPPRSSSPGAATPPPCRARRWSSSTRR